MQIWKETYHHKNKQNIVAYNPISNQISITTLKLSLYGVLNGEAQEMFAGLIGPDSKAWLYITEHNVAQ